MHIIEAHYDNWKKGKDFGEEINAPSWEDIEKIIVDLNGINKTEVTIGNYDEGFYMCISGGSNNRYVVYISYNDEELFYFLKNLEKDANITEYLVTGGQEGRFKANECVSKDVALKAAKYFFSNIEPDPELDWERG